MSIDINMLKRVARDRYALHRPFTSRFMPKAMLDLIDLIESQRERISAYEPVINAALAVKDDHERIGQIDEAIGNLPVEMWP